VPLVIRRATSEDIVAWCAMVGSDPAGKPSARAWVGEVDGRLIGLGGLALAGGRWFAFLDLSPEGRTHKIALMRLAIRILDEARKDGIRFVYADRNPDEPKAQAWLTRLGFEIDPRSQHYYRWSAKPSWQD